MAKVNSPAEIDITLTREEFETLREILMHQIRDGDCRLDDVARSMLRGLYGDRA